MTTPEFQMKNLILFKVNLHLLADVFFINTLFIVK